MVGRGSMCAMQNAPAKKAAWTPRPSPQVKRSLPSRQQQRQLVAASLPIATSATWQQRGWQLVALCLASLQLAVGLPAIADTSSYTIERGPATAQEEEDEQYFITVPQDLDSADKETGPRLGSLIEGPKGKQVQNCARRCVQTCVRGGQGAPGLGPYAMEKELIVFKEGFRTRKYCLSECTQVCSLQINGKPAAEESK